MTMSGVDAAQRCGTGPLASLKVRLKCERCGMKAAQLAILPPV